VTVTKSHVTHLVDALRAGGWEYRSDPRGVELVLQALIDTEATEVFGAERHERSDERTNWRNGTRDRARMRLLASEPQTTKEAATPQLAAAV
jgi:hypothetical protein